MFYRKQFFLKWDCAPPSRGSQLSLCSSAAINASVQSMKRFLLPVDTLYDSQAAKTQVCAYCITIILINCSYTEWRKSRLTLAATRETRRVRRLLRHSVYRHSNIDSTVLNCSPLSTFRRSVLPSYSVCIARLALHHSEDGGITVNRNVHSYLPVDTT